MLGTPAIASVFAMILYNTHGTFSVAASALRQRATVFV